MSDIRAQARRDAEFDRAAEAWEYVERLMSKHRVTMGEIQAQLMGRRYAQRHTEEDGA